MNNVRKIVPIVALASLLAPGILSLCGCGDPGMAKEDPAVAQKRLDSAKDLRNYFDKAQGKFDSLSAEDKQAVVAITGSEANAREAFSHMVLGKPGGGTGGGLPPSGPPGGG